MSNTSANARSASRGDERVALVIVDSLQGLPRGVERSSSGERLRRLKRLAQDLETPVVVTIRLAGRESGEGGGEGALLEDLRTSVAEPVEEEADVVLALDLNPALDESPERFGEADLYVTKNRGGSRGSVVPCFLYRRGTFHTLSYRLIRGRPAWGPCDNRDVRDPSTRVTVNGADISGSYVVAEQRDDATLVLEPARERSPR